MDGTAAPARLREHPWRRRYRTKAHDAEGRPTDILREFYLPALACAERYDRVAGYFSSSSLAVASQGFTALARRGGKARLIVGADLDLADVAAALAGEEVRLAGRLLPALDLDGAAEPVRRGVMLLAWLVAQGAMQLRVALRVHARTREPLPFDSVEDGYVHEKWGVIADGCGDRLYFTGSLNESRTALVLNAENLDVHGSWQGEDALHRVAEAEQDFARLWADEDRGLRVLPLPEAVRLRLIAVAERLRHPVEIDGTAGDAAGAPPPSPEERLRFAVIRNAPRMPGGRWVGMATAPVAPWPHQEIVARRLVETFPLSWLLCDEVGLGKTIEAGLAIRSLVLAGLARRVLIAAPASLTRQWQRELATKFLLDFGRALGGAPRHVHILGEEREVAAASIYAPPLTIVSTGLLAREDRQAELAAAEPWDLVLVDEAHYARRKNPQAGVRGAAEFGRLYRTIETLRTRTKALWLATATPMQLDPIEAWDLMRLTRRVGSFGEDAPTTLRVYELLGRLAAGETLEDDEDELLRRMVLEVQRLDPPLWAWIEETVIDGASRRAVRQWLDDGRRPRGRDGDGLRRLVFAAAPLSRVMLRHTRSLLEEYRARGELKARLARRNLLRLQPITLSDQERRVYDALEDYGEGLADRLGRRLAANRARGAVQFYLSFLRLRFASSLHAIRQTLARRLQRVEAALDHVAASINDERGIETLDDLLDDADDDRPEEELLLQGRAEADLRWERDRLRALLAELADIAAMPSKMTELLKALDRRRRGNRLAQTVVFTRFADTMEDIVGRLRALDSSMLIGTYSGAGGRCTDADARQLVPVEREEVKHRFRRGEIDVLVCTDAAAEGLNLQSADLLVNFDLPWNPMKVEQRIGRIDRIGQAHDKIFVLNLAYAGSAEEIVYDRLLKRLAEAQLVVGTQQLALLPVTPEEFAELACRGVDEAKIAEIEREARKRAERQRARSRAMELSAEEQYGIYRRLAHRERAEALPADLDGIWRTLTESEHLRALGCRLAGTDPIRSQILLIDGIPGLPPSALTADRDLIERGIPDLDRQLRFAAHGERVFDAVLAHLTSFEAPPAVHWAEIPLDSGCSAVACVAAPAGGAPPLLIEGLASLDGWTLAAATPAEAAMTEPVTGLRRRLAQQPGPFWAACRIEAANRVASFSQAAFVHAVMAGLIACEQGAGRGHEVFTRELRRLEGLLGSDRGRLYVKIAADLARRLQCELFDFRPPGTGTDFTFTAPRWLLLGGIDTAWQLAASAKRKDGDLATHDMLRRLRQKAEQFAAELRA